MLNKPVVMGIVNTTPDSFFTESRHSGIEASLRKTEQMLEEGATFIDIGGYSTRPGADSVTVDEELKRTIPVIEAIANRFPEALLSIDTFRAIVAKTAIDSGAHLVNDISAGDGDSEMFQTVADLKVPYIIMHKKGDPATMHHNPEYENVVLEVMDYLAKKTAILKDMGVADIILDPGFGFGKNSDHNYRLFAALKDFQIIGLPLLIGVSRKKMIQGIIGRNANDSLNGTTVLHTLALMQGINILRVHDVKEAVECIKLVDAVNGTI